MRVRYTPRAQSDLDSIFSHLDAQAPRAAQAVKTAIVRRIALLGDFPLLAPLSEISDVRELTIIRYPYKVYYEIENDEVWVLHIRDARRRLWTRNEL
jgi:plasmid stabilization system protein ParE